MTERQQWHVLVVDDYAAFRETVREVLAPDGRFMIVGEAADGREAVAIADQTQPDLVLMDMRLPDMTGLTATETIKARQPHVTVVVLSSDWSAAYERRARAIGVKARLAKQNFSLAELCRILEG